MANEDIEALPISGLAEKDCALFLWVTFPKLYEAWNVMKAWGFKYKTVAFVWLKTNPNVNSLFLAPAIGRELTLKFAYLPPKAIQDAFPNVFIRLSFPNEKNTARSRKKPAAG